MVLFFFVCLLISIFFFFFKNVKKWQMLESCSEVKNARMNPDRDRLVGRMQVRQSKVHDKCNLSHGSAI